MWVLISSKNSRFKLLTGGLFIVTVAMPIKIKFKLKTVSGITCNNKTK